MSKPHSRDKTISTIGGIILIGIVLSSWFPRSCPLLRQTFNACPAGPRVEEPTAEEKEIKRIPHQEVKVGLATFTAKAEKDRHTTSVRFFYRGDLKNELAFLEIRKSGGYADLAIITHPLLIDIKWSSIYKDGFRLYQKDSTYTNIEDFLNNLPAKHQIAIDSVAAKQYKINSGNYTLLDNLSSLDQIGYILTSYTPPTKDGSWYAYDQRFDLQDAAVNNLGNLEWAVYLPNTASSRQPFLLSTVHIDYAQRGL